jgi:hypothetical protein
MSDFNPLDRAKISTHRSSFDLSSKKLFTAKVGEILPCYWQLAIPDNTYRISSDWFTRTVPVNTAGVSTNIRAEGRQMPITEELRDI